MCGDEFLETMDRWITYAENGALDWDAVTAFFAPIGFSKLRNTFQNPAFHGEGDVLSHTKLVCEVLCALPEFRTLPPKAKDELFLAALLHDIGKEKTTVKENGRWISPNHSAVGSKVVRQFLWQECGLSGTPSSTVFRETVCSLIRCHMFPVHLAEMNDHRTTLSKTAEVGFLIPDFSWKLLCLLSEADIRGRISSDCEDSLFSVDLCRLAAEEMACYESPLHFRNAYTKRAFFKGRNVHQEQILFDDTWGEVILLSGLPGTGKDTWIQRNVPDIPMVSLDDIRRELSISPTEDQGSVIHEAQKRARKLLGEKQPFVWNATNVTREIRLKQVELFERYGARVRIIWLETGWDTLLERNNNRKTAVPQAVIEQLLAKTSPPLPDEAQMVEWICV